VLQHVELKLVGRKRAAAYECSSCDGFGEQLTSRRACTVRACLPR
jgi:hypothetical protein